MVAPNHLNSRASLLEHLLAGDPRGGPTPSFGFFYLLRQVYNSGDGTLGRNLERLSSLCDRFIELYQDGPIHLLRAPARINILGEHVDYVSYMPTYSLPFGSREHDMLMLYRTNETGQVRGASTHEDYPPFAFAPDEGPAAGTGDTGEGAWLSYLYDAPTPQPHWGGYVKGSCFFARAKFGERVTRGYDFIVDSNIPPKGGASSSSTLVVLAGAAIRKVNGISFQPGELARDSSKAEWFVGTRGGSMDHLTICLARKSHAVRISYWDQSTRLVPLPGERLRWVTFFSHAADKGREIMLEYNERAAVSRLLIPAIIEASGLSHPQLHASWGLAIEGMLSGAAGAADQIELLLDELPETITLDRVEVDYPEAYRDCAESFPALVTERHGRPLRVRACALHHLGEIRRVSAAERLLDSRDAGRSVRQDFSQGASLLGKILNESHASLRDLYAVSTPEVEALTNTILADPNVYGARLMGGGFGGNVLALTTQENLTSLVERVQSEFYAARGRDGVSEGSVMISTPGDGLSELSLEAVWREAVEEFNTLGRKAGDHSQNILKILDLIDTDAEQDEVWPVIVAAGKGSRARESGLEAPKPVAIIDGVPAILRVLRNIQDACGNARPPLVLVSPETEAAVRSALEDEDVIFVTQPEPRGTGDAVLHAHSVIKDFPGVALVIWGTQPVVRAQTIRRALKLATLFDDYELVLPTALKEHPYAPVERDASGRIVASRETHLEGASRPDFGETNSGLFVLKSRAMFDALLDLRAKHWLESEQRYDRPGGELGFPNEMINYFAGRAPGVLACPFVEGREEQGIKTLEDVARCERYISELNDEER